MTNYEDRMRRVLDYIHDNPAEDLSLDRLAEIAAMSRFHWHRVFRAVTGETCAQAVRRVRLIQASHALVSSTVPLAEIAAQVGYANLASFSRAFAEAYGLPPAAFRSRGTLVSSTPIKPRGESPMFPIDIESHPARRVAVLPHTGAYSKIGKVFEQLGSILSSRGMWPATKGMVGIFHDNPMEVPEADLRSLAGALIAENAVLEAPLEEMIIPEGRHGVMQFKGPYAGLPAAYDHLYGAWLTGAGHQLRDFPSFEVYLNSPMDTAPEELRTDIYLPIQ